MIAEKGEAVRVKVSEIDGGHASTPQAGLRLYALIEPMLARGESVVLDFEGVKHFSTAFFSASIGRLAEADVAKRLPDLLHCENLPATGQTALDLATGFAIRCRENPRWAAAADEVAREWAERD
jgi:hypothetical protein